MTMSSSRSSRSLQGRPVARAAKRGDRRPLRRLRLLAAEAAAHAAHAAGHERVRQRQNAGDDVLHFARMLGGRIDQHRAVLAGHGERDLAFQIKVLLAADTERAGSATTATAAIALAASPLTKA